MAVRPPVLDDRDFETLRRELVRRIPVHAPEWTDHNPTDPGIAILELFAWLTENLLYRLNRVPEASHLEFLRLLDQPLLPPLVARGFAQLSAADPQGFTVLVPFSPLAARTRALAGKVAFQVTDEIVVHPIEAVVAIKRGIAGAVGTEALLPLLSDSGLATEAEQVTSYETFALPGPTGDLPPPATSFGQAVDGSLWLSLLRPKVVTVDLPVVRRRMSGQVLSIGVVVDQALTGANDVERCPDPGAPPTVRRDIEWQIGTGRFVVSGGKPQIDQPIYRKLKVLSDTTEGLTTTGVVRVRLPEVDGAGDAVFGDWARADLPDEDLMGIGDLPPLLPDEKDEARVVGWIRCFARNEPAPRVRWVGVNVVEVEQAITAQPELLGRGSGQPGLVVKLANAPVLPDSLVIEVQEPAGWVVWRRVDDFGASKADDPHFTLDPATGEIRFGDALFGRAPRRGEAIRARSYRHGGGAQGNIPSGALKSLESAPNGLKVTNPLPMAGGRDGETLERARRRIPELLRSRDRAVAAEDFRSLALGAPGAEVGRVHVLPRHLPGVREDDVPGVVTLVVLPAFDPLTPDTPTPDRAMLRAVCAHLEPRRLVTTELYVTPPEYVPVWVSVAVVPDEGFGVTTVRQWVELAVRQYLAPLPPYGPSGEGWPFDRDVRPSDIAAAVLRVQGVRLVPDVLVDGIEIGPDGTETPIPASEKRVILRSWQLPVVRGVQIVVSDDPDASAEPIDHSEDADGPDRPDGLVPVPTERETC